MAQTLKQTRDNHTNAFSCSHLPNLDDTGGELLCALPAAYAFVHIHLRHNAFHDLKGEQNLSPFASTIPLTHQVFKKMCPI